jgi:pimeloyl-ACP methyl ester carboxylesterase
MSTKVPMRDMVVILPGILGSVLQKDGKDLWAVSGQAISQVLMRSEDTFKNLKLTQDDPYAESLGDGIRATVLIQDTHLIPGLWKIDGYTQTSRLITDHFNVIPGNIYTDPADKAANFYSFPYDWRRDNRANARILKRLIDQRLKCWRERSGAADAKVILLGHSMGGLVSRYYLEVLEGWRDCRALFTFGTPYRGSLNAVNFLANGYKQLFLDLTDVMRSLTSVYQLLPVYKVINVNGEFYRVAELNDLPNIDPTKAKDALAFHREIEAAVERHLQDEQYRSAFTVVPISGTDQPTLQSAAMLLNGKLIVTEDLPPVLKKRVDLNDGDGTVPKVSSIPIERSANFNNFFIAEKHGALQNQAQVLESLMNCLQISQFDLIDVKALQASISLSLEDLYLPDEPINIRARIKSPAPLKHLKAEITSVSGSQSLLSFDFVERETEWELAIADLPAGLYRIKVQAEGLGEQLPTPVHDVFEIVTV